jgi:hypothetical protein
VLCDRCGVPLAVLVSAANTPDAQLLFPLLDSVAPIQSRRGRPRRRPAKLHADKAYDAGVYVLLVTACFAGFYPIYTGS